MTQKEKVLHVLMEAGDKGVNSFWGYANYIPRMGACVFDLKKDGYAIRPITQKNHSCQYFLDMEELKVSEGVYIKPTPIKEFGTRERLNRQLNFWQRLFKSVRITQ